MTSSIPLPLGVARLRVETADGRRVPTDDFDFRTGQPLENKSIADLVPRGAPLDVMQREYRGQMEKTLPLRRATTESDP